MKREIVVVEDHPGFRNKIKDLINSDERLVCQYVYKDANTPLTEIPILNLKPAIVILDYELSKNNDEITGLDVFARLRKILKKTKFIMLTQYPEHGRQAWKLGVLGYVLKYNIYKDLLRSIHGALSDKSVWDEGVLRDILEEYNTQINNIDTPSEFEINCLQLLSEGLTQNQIAKKMKITRDSLKYRLKNLYEKIEAKNDNNAVSIGINNRWI